MTETRAKVGVVVAPRYFDTSGKELLAIAPEIDLLHTQIRVGPEFGFTLDEIIATGDEVERCAIALAEAGADAVIQLGTPFSTAHGWAGGNQLQKRIEDRIDIPFEMMGLSVPAGALALGTTRIAMATTYYGPDWLERYTRFVTEAGLEVTGSESFVDQGVFASNEEAFAASFDGFSSDVLTDTIRQVAHNNPNAECILMPGLPGRFIHRVADLETELGLPVVSYYAIWWRCLSRLGIAPKGQLGALLETGT